MHDAGAPDESEEEEWLPPAPPPDPWVRWRPRAFQAVVVNAVTFGFVVLIYPTGLLPWRHVARWLLCLTPAVALCWIGLFAYFIVRATERPGERLEGGRLLVTNVDALTAIFAILGGGIWAASLIL